MRASKILNPLLAASALLFVLCVAASVVLVGGLRINPPEWFWNTMVIAGLSTLATATLGFCFSGGDWITWRTQLNRVRLGFPQPLAREIAEHLQAMHGLEADRRRGIEALVRLGPQVLPALLYFSREENDSYRAAVLEAIDRIHPEGLMPALIEALRDESLPEHSRWQVYNTLRDMREDALPAVPELLEGIRREPYSKADDALSSIGIKAMPLVLKAFYAPESTEEFLLQLAQNMYFWLSYAAEPNPDLEDAAWTALVSALHDSRRSEEFRAGMGRLMESERDRIFPERRGKPPGLPYSVTIESTDDPEVYTYFSPELAGFGGTGRFEEDCLRNARWEMTAHLERLRIAGHPVPDPPAEPKIVFNDMHHHPRDW